MSESLQLLLHGLVKFLLTQTHVSISISDICVLLIGTGGGKYQSMYVGVKVVCHKITFDLVQFFVVID